MKTAEQKAKRAAYMRRYYATRDRYTLSIVHRHMLTRCYDSQANEYHCYGGRGIRVCDQWIASLDTFREWALASGWSRGLQIDRIDCNGNYTPENCRWVTSRENNRNRTNNKLSVGKAAKIRHMLAEGFTGTFIAREFGVHHSLIYRIKQNKQWV